MYIFRCVVFVIHRFIAFVGVVRLIITTVSLADRIVWRSEEVPAAVVYWLWRSVIQLFMKTLQWGHNGQYGVSYQQPHDCLLVYSSYIQAQINENIKAPRHWPLCGKFTGDRWIPHTNGQWRGKSFHLMAPSGHFSGSNFAFWLNSWNIKMKL